MNQLILPLETFPRMTLSTLVIHRGIEASVTAIRNVYGNSGRPFPSLFLYGPPGTGKSHILIAVIRLLADRSLPNYNASKIVMPEGVPPRVTELEDLVFKTDEELAQFCCIAIDDVHLLEGRDQGHMWNLFNKMTRVGAPLLMASRLPANEVFPEDPHLRSRINSGLVFGLDPPDDQVRILILDKMARDRNVRIPQEVSHYLVTRKSRNVKELEKALEVLDRASLELKRRITLPLLKTLEMQGKI